MLVYAGVALAICVLGVVLAAVLRSLNLLKVEPNARFGIANAAVILLISALVFVGGIVVQTFGPESIKQISQIDD